MKLFHAPGTCAQAPHIALREAGLAFTPIAVDLQKRVTADGDDFLSINPKGYVPVLELDTGERLTEAPAVLQYIADLAPQKNLAPAAGTMGRYRTQEWLNYVSSELHKSFGVLFSQPTDDAKKKAQEKIAMRLKLIDEHLAEREWMVGEHYGIADIFTFVVTGWARHVGPDLAAFPNLQAFQKRVLARPAVKEALQAEKSAG